MTTESFISQCDEMTQFPPTFFYYIRKNNHTTTTTTTSAFTLAHNYKQRDSSARHLKQVGEMFLFIACQWSVGDKDENNE